MHHLAHLLRRQLAGRSLGVAATRLLLGAVWTMLIAYVAIGSLAVDVPLGFPASRRHALLALCPEGWAFFTRDPREPVLRSFAWDGARVRSLDQRNFSRGALFGARRSPRLAGAEMVALLEQVDAGAWQPCATSLDSFLLRTPPEPVPVVNHMRHQTFCGDVVVQLAERVPWAWSRSRRRVVMPSRVVALEVACDE